MSPGTRRIVQLAYVAAVAAGVVIYELYHAEIEAQILVAGEAHGWASWIQQSVWAIAMFLAFAVSIFFSIPAGPLFCIAFGFFYGPFKGALAAGLATTVGSVAAFCFFRRAIPQSASLKGAKVKNVFATLVLLRSSPWLPNPLITLFCSALDVGLATFALSTFIGTMPLIAVYTIAASRLHGHFDASVLYSTDILVAFGILGAVSLIGFLKPVRMVVDSLKVMQAGVPRKK